MTSLRLLLVHLSAFRHACRRGRLFKLDLGLFEAIGGCDEPVDVSGLRPATWSELSWTILSTAASRSLHA